MEAVLSPDIFEDHLDDSASMASVHCAFLKIIKSYLVLVQIRSHKPINECIENLPQQIKKLWKEFLIESPPRLKHLNSALRDVCEYESFESLVKDWRPVAQLAVVDRYAAETFGLCAKKGIFQKVDDSGTFEVCRFDCLSESNQIDQANTFHTQSIEAGAVPNEVWSERLSRLALYSKHIVVCDRYSGKGLIRGEDRSFISPIEWLLKKIDGCGKSFVHVVTQFEEEFDLKCIDEGFCRIGGLLTRGGIKDLKVSYVPKRLFTEKAHGRHLRFDDKAIWLDSGIDFFGDRRVKQLYGFTVFDHKEARSREEDLVKKAKWTETYV